MLSFNLTISISIKVLLKLTLSRDIYALSRTGSRVQYFY